MILLKMKKFKKEIIEWSLILGVAAVLFFTGTYVEVMAQVQRVVLATGFMQPNLKKADLTENAPLAEDLQLVSLDGKKVKLSDYRGKVVFMNFWATWCGPCIAEMPNINSLYKKLEKEEGIAFLMVSFDENPEKAKKYVNKKSFTFPVFSNPNPREPFPAPFNSEVIPVTFIISPEGKIAQRIEGMAEYDNDKFKNFLLSLRKKK